MTNNLQFFPNLFCAAGDILAATLTTQLSGECNKLTPLGEQPGRGIACNNWALGKCTLAKSKYMQ